MGSDVDVIGLRRTVVAALPLSLEARTRLAEQLDGARVVDIRDPVDVADLVLAPSCSPQTVAALKASYPTARLVVVELEDWEFGIDLPGPVKRLLDAGADGYVAANSIGELADVLVPGSGVTDDELAGARTDAVEAPDELARAGVDDVIMATLADRLHRPHVPAEQQPDAPDAAG